MGNMRHEKSSGVLRRLSKYSLYFLVMASVMLVFVILVFRVDAEVAVFLSDDHVEEEIVLDTVDENGVQYVERERRWSNFQGSVPEGAPVNKVVFRLGWTVGDVVVREEVLTPVNADVTQTVESTLEESVIQTNTEETTSLEAGPSGGRGGDSEVSPEMEVTPVPAEVSESPTVGLEIEGVEILPSPSETVIEAPQESPLPEVIEETPSVEENVSQNEVSGFEPVSLLHTYPWATALIEEGIEAETVLQLSDIVAVDEVNVETSIDDVVGTTSTSTNIIPAIPEGFLELRYSLDGINWHALDTVEYNVVTSIESFLVLVGIEDIPNLQISARYVVPQGTTFALYFDTVRLEAEYGVLLEEVVIPEEIPSDQEPNFNSSVIKADIISENIRAVVLERGGMLEFWYSVTNTQSGDIQWQKLVGGGAIQEGSPIGIKERTIFWFDKNQETLFGFSVDTESIFGVPYQSPENRTFRLPFETENDEYWQAMYKPEDGLLTFERVRKVSP